MLAHLKTCFDLDLMIAFITGEQYKTAIYESQSKDSFEGDIDSIVVRGVRLNMINLDTFPGGGHRLVLEDKVNPSVESVKYRDGRFKVFF